jgi:hypothetical protein
MYVVLFLANYAMLVVWRPLVVAMAGAVLLGTGLWADSANASLWTEIASLLTEEMDIGGFVSPFFDSTAWAPQVQLMVALCDAGLCSWRNFYPPIVELGAFHLLSFAAAFLRILLSLGILASFLLREWLSTFASTLWARVCESDKGAFTLILGAIGSLVGGLKAILA